MERHTRRVGLLIVALLFATFLLRKHLMSRFSNLFQWLHGKSEKSRSRVGQSRKLQVSELEPRLLLSGTHFDFGTPTSPVASGYVGVPVVAYTSTMGYGWTSIAGITALDRGTTDSLTRDFHTANDGTFEVDVPNGLYQVTTKLGDALGVRDNIDMFMNGNQVGSNITTQAGQVLKKTDYVEVTNGQLALRLVDNGGSTITPGWALDSLDVVAYTGPTVSTGSNQSVNEGSQVTFKGTATGAGPLSYAWNFGDGATATGTLTPKHTYDDNGKYVVTLTVIDSYGLSTTKTCTVSVANVNPRPNALGTYSGIAGKAVQFTGIARDPSEADLAAGFTYAWNFGDGKTGSGPVPVHTYASANTYTVTLTVTDKDGGSRSTTTTAVILPATTASPPRGEYQFDSTNLLANTAYNCLSWSEMASDGAWGVNAQWEQGTASQWYIEQQRYGEDLIIGGSLHNNTAAIEAGLKMFDWGFAHQAADGSFSGTADPFHSTSIFVQSVANATLALKQSPYAQQYQAKIITYTDQLYQAAKWMTSSGVWSKGISFDAPYTHRRFIVADALAMTSKLVGGDSQLMNLARYEISNAISLQWSNGVLPEDGGYDSSYQVYGLSLAERWVTYFPNDSVSDGLRNLINRGLAWEQSMILATGEINSAGNTRSFVETGPSGTIKTIDWKNAVDAFAYWYAKTGNRDWLLDGQEIAQYYYKGY